MFLRLYLTRDASEERDLGSSEATSKGASHIGGGNGGHNRVIGGTIGVEEAPREMLGKEEITCNN